MVRIEGYRTCQIQKANTKFYFRDLSRMHTSPYLNVIMLRRRRRGRAPFDRWHFATCSVAPGGVQVNEQGYLSLFFDGVVVLSFFIFHSRFFFPMCAREHSTAPALRYRCKIDHNRI